MGAGAAVVVDKTSKRTEPEPKQYLRSRHIVRYLSTAAEVAAKAAEGN